MWSRTLMTHIQLIHISKYYTNIYIYICIINIGIHETTRDCFWINGNGVISRNHRFDIIYVICVSVDKVAIVDDWAIVFLPLKWASCKFEATPSLWHSFQDTLFGRHTKMRLYAGEFWTLSSNPYHVFHVKTNQGCNGVERALAEKVTSNKAGKTYLN